MSNKSGIAEQVISFARGGGEMKGLGETFSPDLHTGTGNFPDQWYGLHHPELSDTPMTVRFDIRRDDFPANLSGLKMRQLVLYFSRLASFEEEIPEVALAFNGAGAAEKATQYNFVV